MQASVQEGTSRTSKVQGYSSGGKTGTAEKLPRGNKKYVVSFITFAPVDDPALVMLMSLMQKIRQIVNILSILHRVFFRNFFLI